MNNFETINYKKIGKFITDLRKEKNMTQEELAEKIPIGRQAVSKWERGVSIPDASTLIILSEIFDVTINDILKGKVVNSKDKEKKDEVLLGLYDERNKNKKKLKYLFITILILIFSFFIYYFFMSYGKTKIYNVSGESEYSTSVNGVFVETNEKLYFTIYDISYLDELEFRGMTLFYKDKDDNEHLIAATPDQTMHLVDYKGYKAIFDIDDLDYILDNMYLKLSFENKIEVEIKINVNLEYTNNKLFVKKKDSISDEQNSKENNEIQEKDYELRNKLLEVMTKDDDGYYRYTYKDDINYTYTDGFGYDIVHISIGDDDSSIAIRYLSLPTSKIIRYHQSENGKNIYSLSYQDGASSCTYGECEYIDVSQVLEYYLNLIIDYDLNIDKK